MENLLKIYRIHLKIVKNKFIRLLCEYPILAFAGVLLLGIILTSTFKLYINFVTQVNGFVANIDDAAITKITRNYINVLLISSIIIPYVYNTFYEVKDKIIEIIYALPYDNKKIRKMWNIPMYSFIIISAMFLLTPYSLYILRLNKMNGVYTIYILFVQYLYMFCCLLVSNIITKLVKKILYKNIKMKSEYKLNICFVLVSDIFILLVVLLFNSNMTNKYIPTQFIMNTIYIIKHLGIKEFLFNLILNFANIGVMIYLYFTISNMINYNKRDVNISEISNRININENQTMVYFRILTKKIVRNKEGLIGLISMFFIIIVAGYFVASSNILNISVPQLYSFNVYLVYILLGVYIISFDDMDVIECVKNYNGNIMLYNLIYILENSLLILFIYFIEDGVLCLLCGIKFSTIFSISKINILMLSNVAMLFKNFFISKDSSKVMQFISIYSFIITILLIGYLGAKLSAVISIALNINTNAIDTVLISMFTIIFYLLQFAILKIKERRYV